MDLEEQQYQEEDLAPLTKFLRSASKQRGHGKGANPEKSTESSEKTREAAASILRTQAQAQAQRTRYGGRNQAYPSIRERLGAKRMVKAKQGYQSQDKPLSELEEDIKLLARVCYAFGTRTSSAR